MMDPKIKGLGLLITVKLYTVILRWQTRLQLVQSFLHHTERKQISPKDSSMKYSHVFWPHTWHLITPAFSQYQWVTKNIWPHLNLPSLQNIWFSCKDFTVRSNYVKCLEYTERTIIICLQLPYFYVFLPLHRKRKKSPPEVFLNSFLQSFL